MFKHILQQLHLLLSWMKCKIWGFSAWPFNALGVMELDGQHCDQPDGTSQGVVSQIRTYFDTVSWLIFSLLPRILLQTAAKHILGCCYQKPGATFDRCLWGRRPAEAGVVAEKKVIPILSSRKLTMSALMSCSYLTCWLCLELLSACWTMPLLEAIEDLVLKPFSGKLGAGRSKYLNLVPMESMEEFYLPLTAFDMTKDAKNGCGGFEKTMLRCWVVHVQTSSYSTKLFWNVGSIMFHQVTLQSFQAIFSFATISMSFSNLAFAQLLAQWKFAFQREMLRVRCIREQWNQWWPNKNIDYGCHCRVRCGARSARSCRVERSGINHLKDPCQLCSYSMQFYWLRESYAPLPPFPETLANICLIGERETISVYFFTQQVLASIGLSWFYVFASQMCVFVTRFLQN